MKPSPCNFWLARIRESRERVHVDERIRAIYVSDDEFREAVVEHVGWRTNAGEEPVDPERVREMRILDVPLRKFQFIPKG